MITFIIPIKAFFSNWKRSKTQTCTKQIENSQNFVEKTVLIRILNVIGDQNQLPICFETALKRNKILWVWNLTPHRHQFLTFDIITLQIWYENCSMCMPDISSNCIPSLDNLSIYLCMNCVYRIIYLFIYVWTVYARLSIYLSIYELCRPDYLSIYLSLNCVSLIIYLWTV